MNQINPSLVSSFFEGRGKRIYSLAESAVNDYSMRKYIESGVLVGLSGGADSVMLLCFLLEYGRRNSLEFAIAAAHINHGIRGEEADADESFCVSLCEMLGVELIINRFAVPKLAKDSGKSIEEAARTARYLSFDELISGRNDLGAIAVAHNMSDNAETVLFNSLRGSGARGAAGIRPVRDNIFRPLIRVGKADIASALDDAGIPYVTDSTNLCTDYSRNYIRHEIIPRLERITEQPEKMLLRLSENLRLDDDYITSVALDFLSDRVEVLNSELLSLHFSVYIRVLSLMASSANSGISSKIASDIRNMLRKDNFSYSLIGGAAFVCERGSCRVIRNNAEPSDYCISVADGITRLDPFKADFLLFRGKIDKSYHNVYKKSIQANLSSAIICGSLYLRPKMDGDTVYYGGMTHKLKKLFNDRKIPVSKRRLIPILCDDKGVVWVPGFGVRDDRTAENHGEDIFVLLGLRETDENDGGRFYSGAEFG